MVAHRANCIVILVRSGLCLLFATTAGKINKSSCSATSANLAQVQMEEHGGAALSLILVSALLWTLPLCAQDRGPLRIATDSLYHSTVFCMADEEFSEQ